MYVCLKQILKSVMFTQEKCNVICCLYIGDLTLCNWQCFALRQSLISDCCVLTGQLHNVLHSVVDQLI